MLSEYITSLADVSFHIVAYMYARFRYSGKNPMRFAVFWRISVRFCGFRTPLTPPSLREQFPPLIFNTYSALDWKPPTIMSEVPDMPILLTTTVVQIVPNSKLTLLPNEDLQYAVNMLRSISYADDWIKTLTKHVKKIWKAT